MPRKVTKAKRAPLARVSAKKSRSLEVPAELAHLDTARAALARVLKPYALNTQRTYRIAWARWSAWCTQHGVAVAPIEAMRLVTHLEELATKFTAKSVRTTLAALSAIDSTARGMRGDKDTTPIRAHPVVRAWLKSWARAQAGKGPRKAPPLGPSELLSIVRSIDASRDDDAFNALARERLAKRDRALFALGWFGAMRRSELGALDLDDVRETPKGLEVTIRKSKTDQEGEGATVALYAQAHPELCPVQVWRAWRIELEAMRKHAWKTGAFATVTAAFPRVMHDGSMGARLSDASVSAAIARRAKAVGITASSHSLRGGFATAAGEAGKQERDIQAHGRWKSVNVVRGYVSRGDQWNALNPTKDLT